MLALLLALALPAQSAPWKAGHVALIWQHSGAQRSVGPSVLTMLTRLLDDKPEAAELTLIGFEAK